MHAKRFLSAARLGAGALLLTGLAAHAADDLSALPANLGGGLRQLAAWHAANAANLPPERRAAAVQEQVQSHGQRVQTDAAGRVVVDVYLNGAAPESDVRAALAALGAEFIASVPAGRSTAAAHGVVSAYLPVGQAAAAAASPGVQSVVLVHRPWRRVGVKTSQGLPPMKVNGVQRRHITGKGITVGALSDSYDLTSPHAATDVLHDDLPGVGNRAKRTTPVNVLQDGDPADQNNADEGRAILQIVHDVAPDSALAFCTAGMTQAAFADGIRSLRTQANCDVIVDDIGFPDEPIFSDGIVSQAVEDVVNSTTLAGKKALYYSAAGNGGALGYEADFSPVTDADARAGQAGANNLQLWRVPAAFTGGGFHNFTPGAGPNIAQKIIVNGSTAEFDFQWNDLFDAARMTSDFNLLVFDVNGRYLSAYSGTDDNFNTGQAVEIVDLNPNYDGSEVTYQFAIARTSAGAGTAQHFRYLVDTDGGIDGSYLQFSVPTIIGHSGARSADGVGAYAYNKLAHTEDFSSFGPVAIYFDDHGARRTTPEVRMQPTISAPDGVATAMPRFNPFFGTSAAVPHAGAVAALILEAAGGPGSLTPAQVRQALQATTRPHDLDPLVTTATSTTKAGTVTLSGYGDGSNFSSATDQFFTLHFDGPAGSQLKSVLIDLTAAALKFDPSTLLGFPFTLGEASGGASASVTSALLPGNRKLLLTFTAFPVGGMIRFGIDRDLASTSAAGNAAEQLAKGVVTASILPPGAAKAVTQKGIFVDRIGSGYTPADGFGFINADAALKSLGH